MPKFIDHKAPTFTLAQLAKRQQHEEGRAVIQQQVDEALIIMRQPAPQVDRSRRSQPFRTAQGQLVGSRRHY